MNEFYKQDVFFFVTTIAVVILTIVLAIAIVYIIKILKDLKYISKRAKQETDNLAADIQELRANVRQEGMKMKYAGKFFSNLLKRFTK